MALTPPLTQCAEPKLKPQAGGADFAKESNALTEATTISLIPPGPSIETAWQDVHYLYERFCLSLGIEALEHALYEDNGGAISSNTYCEAPRTWDKIAVPPDPDYDFGPGS